MYNLVLIFRYGVICSFLCQQWKLNPSESPVTRSGNLHFVNHNQQLSSGQPQCVFCWRFQVQIISATIIFPLVATSQMWLASWKAFLSFHKWIEKFIWIVRRKVLPSFSRFLPFFPKCKCSYWIACQRQFQIFSPSTRSHWYWQIDVLISAAKLQLRSQHWGGQFRE